MYVFYYQESILDNIATMSVENSVVKIISTIVVPEYTIPWTTRKKGKATGTGFCINASKKGTKIRILTNAHVVDGATRITIIKQGSSINYHAIVDSIIHECDLALLKIDSATPSATEKKFWDTTPPLEIGSVPRKSSKVRCYGYPLGGENLSITKGVISRVEILSYMNIASGIAIQIDAAINPGNSGGPAIGHDGKVVGVVFAGIDASGVQNMGYIIPTFLIRYFLRYIAKYGEFDGLSYLGIDVQNLENENLRKFAQLSPTQTGVLINNVIPGSSADGSLRVGDILTKINGKDVDYDGAIKLFDVIADFNESKYSREPAKSQERENNDFAKESIFMSTDEVVNYGSMIGLKVPGEQIKVSIVRDGKNKIVTITLVVRDFLVPIAPYQMKPLYYIVGGLVFMPISRMYIIEKLKIGADIDHLVSLYGGGFPEEKGEQIIVLSEILSTGLTHGYESNNNVLHAINGTVIRSMDHLRKVMDGILKKPAKKNEYIIFEYKDSADLHVLNFSDVKKYNKKIVEENIGMIPLTNVT
jgi:S1-C subfamily serine protease